MSAAVLDGIHTQHGGSVGSEIAAQELADLVRAVVRGTPTPASLAGLHAASAQTRSVAVAEGLADALADLPADRVRRVGRWLAQHGTRRDSVAIGLVLLGLTGDARDRELLLLLGALESLTLYAAEALSRTQPDPERAVFELARRVEGWGRIHAVERLRECTDPEVKAWLLRGGYRNAVMDEYLAHLAATTGDLAGALDAETVDEALLLGAGGILRALCEGGPAADMRHYPDGPVAVASYLCHADRQPADLRLVAAVGVLRRFASSAKAVSCWTAAERARLQAMAEQLCDRPDWRQLVQDALDDEDLEVVKRGLWQAALVGVPFTDQVTRQLRRAPYDFDLWYALVDYTEDIDPALRLADELLPLAELVTGPTLAVGSCGQGPEGILDLVVSRLDAHPGKGWPLIAVALSNRTIRNREMALLALKAWPAALITAEMRHALLAAAGREPDRGMRGRMRIMQDRWLSAR